MKLYLQNNLKMSLIACFLELLPISELRDHNCLLNKKSILRDTLVSWTKSWLKKKNNSVKLLFRTICKSTIHISDRSLWWRSTKRKQNLRNHKTSAHIKTKWRILWIDRLTVNVTLNILGSTHKRRFRLWIKTIWTKGSVGRADICEDIGVIN